MESFNSRDETENRSLLLDTQMLEELQLMVRERMGYHNGLRRHSTIGYQASARYVETHWLRSSHHNSDALKVSKKWSASPLEITAYMQRSIIIDKPLRFLDERRFLNIANVGRWKETMALEHVDLRRTLYGEYIRKRGHEESI